MANKDDLIPVTVLTGFLGSGKTVSAEVALASTTKYHHHHHRHYYHYCYYSYTTTISIIATIATRIRVMVDDVLLLYWQTLLNHILTEQHGKRIAVIENGESGRLCGTKRRKERKRNSAEATGCSWLPRRKQQALPVALAVIVLVLGGGQQWQPHSFVSNDASMPISSSISPSSAFFLFLLFSYYYYYY